VRVGDRGLASLNGLDELQISGLREVTDAGFRAIAEQRSLRSLNAQDLPLLTERSASALSNHPQLIELGLGGSLGLGAAGVDAIATCTSLEVLGLSGWTLTDHDLRRLNSLPRLRELVV